MTQRIVDNLKGNKDWTKEKIAERKSWALTELGRVFDVDLFQEVKEEIEEESEPAPTIETQEIYAVLRSQVLALSPEIKEEKKKHYVAFKKKLQNFLTAKVQQSKIKVWLSLEEEDIQSNPLVHRDVSDMGHHGTGDLEIEIDSKEQIPALMELVKKAYVHTAQNFTEYSIEDHIRNISNSNVRKKVEMLLSKIKEEFPTAEQYATKGWVVIKNNKLFVSLACSKTKIWLNLSYPEEVFQSAKFAFEDNVKEKRWKFIAITEDTNLDELMPFVKMAYEKN